MDNLEKRFEQILAQISDPKIKVRLSNYVKKDKNLLDIVIHLATIERNHALSTSKYHKLLNKWKYLDISYARIVKEKNVIIGKNSFPIIIRKSGDIIYLDSVGLPKDYCSVCMKKKKTTSHHIIPKRVQAVNILLAKIRIRVCEECEDKIHCENKEIDGVEIIKNQSQLIKKLEKQRDFNFDNTIKEYIIWLNKKLERDKTYVQKIPYNTFDKKKIHPMQKYYEGKIFTFREVIRTFKRMLAKAQGQKVNRRTK